MYHLHINWKGHAACDLNIIVKDEGHLKVAGSYVHWKSDNMREIVRTRHLQDMILVYGISNSSNCNDLEYP